MHYRVHTGCGMILFLFLAQALQSMQHPASSATPLPAQAAWAAARWSRSQHQTPRSYRLHPWGSRAALQLWRAVAGRRRQPIKWQPAMRKLLQIQRQGSTMCLAGRGRQVGLPRPCLYAPFCNVTEARNPGATLFLCAGQHPGGAGPHQESDDEEDGAFSLPDSIKLGLVSREKLWCTDPDLA